MWGVSYGEGCHILRRVQTHQWLARWPSCDRHALCCMHRGSSMPSSEQVQHRQQVDHQLHIGTCQAHRSQTQNMVTQLKAVSHKIYYGTFRMCNIMESV